MHSDQAEFRRIFFALRPDEKVRAELQVLLNRLPAGLGCPYAEDDLHLTLAFIGKADQDYYHCLKHAAATVRFQPITFDLTHFGYFAKPEILWAGPAATDVDSKLAPLAQILNQALQNCAYSPEMRAYTPHVTLLRNSKPLLKPVEFKPITWQTDRFCLVESHEPRNGRRYSILEEFIFNKITESHAKPRRRPEEERYR